MKRAALFLSALLLGSPVQAEEDASAYPSRTVKLVVPAAPGGPVDAVARILADGLRAVWKESIIVESKPGAGNATGAIFVANSPPDGYTLLVISDSITVNPSLYPNLDKDPLRQFAPVAMLVTAPQVLLARPDLPANTLRDFIEAGKKQPPMNVASAGTGTISHLTEVLLEQRTGGKTAHIPFRGAAPAVTAVLGKHVDAAWLMPAPALPYIASGQMKAIAVTGPVRDPKLPNVPTVEEAGLPDFQVMNWQGLFAPANTPRPVVDKIAAAVAAVTVGTEKLVEGQCWACLGPGRRHRRAPGNVRAIQQRQPVLETGNRSFTAQHQRRDSRAVANALSHHLIETDARAHFSPRQRRAAEHVPGLHAVNGALVGLLVPQAAQEDQSLLPRLQRLQTRPEFHRGTLSFGPPMIRVETHAGERDERARWRQMRGVRSRSPRRMHAIKQRQGED